MLMTIITLLIINFVILSTAHCLYCVRCGGGGGIYRRLWRVLYTTHYTVDRICNKIVAGCYSIWLKSCNLRVEGRIFCTNHRESMANEYRGSRVSVCVCVWSLIKTPSHHSHWPISLPLWALQRQQLDSEPMQVSFSSHCCCSYAVLINLYYHTTPPPPTATTPAEAAPPTQSYSKAHQPLKHCHYQINECIPMKQDRHAHRPYPSCQ